MKVTGVRTTCFGLGGELRCAVELDTDIGLIGVAVGAAATHDNAARVVDELLKHADPIHAAALWEDMAKANARVDGSISATIAALDMALWDLKAKANGEPLWRTLGGLRPRANTHARLPTSATDDAAVRAWCDAFGSRVRGIVIEACDRPDHDAHRFAIARAAVGDDRALMLGAREQWAPKDAIRHIASLEQSTDLTWIEAPTASADFLGHKRITDSIRGAVCAGGRLHSASQFLPHLHHHSLNVVQLDPSRLGITAALRIADAAYGFELPIALTASFANTNAHLAAVLPYCMSVEVDQPVDGIESDVTLTDGHLVAGDRPGNGLSLNTDALRRSQATRT